MKFKQLPIIAFYIIALMIGQLGWSQDTDTFKWWDPEENEFLVLEGQAWPDEVDSFYFRLPGRVKNVVRKPVWNLSKHATGLLIRFQSDATQVQVRYATRKRNELNHIPETGVRGVDLYAIDSNGEWMWCRPNRKFSDTIVYRYQGINPQEPYHDKGREYRLYLPYYSSLEWLKIGVPTNSQFTPLKKRKEKPIVIYGTSIAHGACASRPGMTWTNILGRKMDRPLINLAFSGNGRLEMELIRLLSEIDAKIYVLDCLPNLWNATLYDDSELSRRVIEAVKYLKEKRPNTPIMLTEHAGYTDELIQQDRGKLFRRVNSIQKSTYYDLLQEGLSNLHYLTRDQLGLGIEDMVDGTHPNDLGMMKYATGYEKKLREILTEPKGIITTTKPVPQNRDGKVYDWISRHQQILEMKGQDPASVVILGNSIMHFWGGKPEGPIVRDGITWDSLYTPHGVQNYAFGWDRIENVLWRVYHDELDGLELKKVIIAIGTNNLHLNTDLEIVEGLRMLAQAIRSRQPQAKLVMMGILPRRDLESRVLDLNKKIAIMAGSLNLDFADIGDELLSEDLQINESFFLDGLHPNESGYKKLGMRLWPILQNRN